MIRRALPLLLLTALATAPVHAHHYFRSNYDAARPMRLKGSVTRIEWTNPHSHFFLDVRDAAGKVTNWSCESGSPGTLAREGLMRSDLKAGDMVTFDIFPARDGSRIGITRRIVLPDGRTITTPFAGDPGGLS